MKKVYIRTYGCQMNVYDSSKILDLLMEDGYSSTDNPEDASVIIINTCHIREKASEKTFSEIGKFKKIKSKTGAVLILAGCVVQANDEIISSRVPYVDIAVGPQNYHEIPIMLKEISNKMEIRAEFLMDKFNHLPYTKKSNYVNYLAVQEGCDKFCAYCVVPFTRGIEYSRPVEDVVNEARAMVSAGAIDIMLLGQNVNAYHGEDKSGKERSLAYLVKKMEEIEGLERIKYMTSYPSQMDEGLIEAHKDVKKLMPFVHIPIQSGSDRVLKNMNRKYSVREYKNIIESLRKARSDIAFSSDFIVGFPGETEEDFNDTLKLINDVFYSQSFSFKFSGRPGTSAYDIKEGIVSEKIKNERLKILQDKLLEQQKSFNEKFIGRELEVLLENPLYSDGREIFGRSEYMQSINVLADKKFIGKIVKVKIKKANRNTLKGEMVCQKKKL